MIPRSICIGVAIWIGIWIGATPVASGAEQPEPGDRSKPHTILACEGAAEGDDCSFTTRAGEERNGKCAPHPLGLACRPPRAIPAGSGRGVPVSPQFKACEVLGVGDACAFARRGEEVRGQCTKRGARMFCRVTGTESEASSEDE